MTRLTFRIPRGLFLLGPIDMLYWKRMAWIERQANEKGCFIDTHWVEDWDAAPDFDIVLLVPPRTGSWVPDPLPELRQWIEGLGFEVVGVEGEETADA